MNYDTFWVYFQMWKNFKVLKLFYELNIIINLNLNNYGKRHSSRQTKLAIS